MKFTLLTKSPTSPKKLQLRYTIRFGVGIKRHCYLLHNRTFQHLEATIIMPVDSDILRQLHKIQKLVPDKDFFSNQQTEIEADLKKRRKGKKSRLLSGAPFIGNKKISKIDIESAREKIKSFNNSFKGKKRRIDPSEIADLGMMSIQDMKDFREQIKEAAEAEEHSHMFRALEGIIKFIDLKNSGIITGRQDVLFDCIKKVALVLMENGGLSMFHATWFHSIYREYIRSFRVFRGSEYETASASGSKEIKEIAKHLYAKQYEFPQYLQLIDDEKRDIKQLIRYSRDPYIKRSIHGQKGCTFNHIKKIFHEKVKADQSKSGDRSYINEINIIVSYANFFSRFPMMHPLVEKIVQTIPNLNTETTLYKEKIMITLNLVQLDLMRGVSQYDGSDTGNKRLFDATYAVFKRCTNMIRDNRLNESNLFGDIHAFPFLKQAMVLITHKQTLSRDKRFFLKMIENSQQILGVLKEAAKGPQRHLMKTIELLEIYERNLDSILDHIKDETAADSPSSKKKKQEKS